MLAPVYRAYIVKIGVIFGIRFHKICWRWVGDKWGFRGRAIEWCQKNSTTTDPCCHGNENLEESRQLLGFCRRYLWASCTQHEFLRVLLLTDSTTTKPRCHGNEIWNKIDNNSICIGNIIEILAPIRCFGGLGIEWRQKNLQLTAVAMATKFYTN